MMKGSLGHTVYVEARQHTEVGLVAQHHPVGGVASAQLATHWSVRQFASGCPQGWGGHGYHGADYCKVLQTEPSCWYKN